MLNNVILIGRLGQDPDLQYSQKGTAFVEFALADDVTPQDGVQFINVIAWGDQAENHAEYLDKGDMAAVIGSLDIGKWTDDDGKTRYSPQVKARNVVYLGGSQSKGDSGESSDVTDAGPDSEENLPF